MKLTAETVIRCDPEMLWRRTQVPEEHARWDLRFTDIEYLPRDDPGAPQRFRYATRIGFGRTIEGWGETVGQGDQRGSALRFGSADPKSLIREGAGCWIFQDDPAGVRFSTVYDYDARYGRLGRAFDRLLFRPLMVWATRWSFDRLRLWIEKGLAPEAALRLWLAKLVARGALGLTCLAAGVATVRAAGSPLAAWPGAAELLAGLWLISGRAERLAVALVALALLLGTGPGAMLAPAAVHGAPLGETSARLGLLACAAVVWILAPLAPNAARASGRQRGNR
jgi:hypothetical protein